MAFSSQDNGADLCPGDFFRNCVVLARRLLRRQLQRKRSSFGSAVALGLQPFGTNGCELGFCGFKISAESRLGMQPCYRCRSKNEPLLDIALPMGIAHDTAFAKRTPPHEYRIGPVRHNLGKDQRPAPSGRGMSGRIGAALQKMRAVLRGAEGFIVQCKRTGALIMILGCSSSTTKIAQRSAQQLVEARSVRLGDRGIRCARIGAGCMRKLQVGIRRRQLPACGIAQGKAAAAGILIQREGGGACLRWWRKYGQTVRNSVSSEITGNVAGKLPGCCRTGIMLHRCAAAPCTSKKRNYDNPGKSSFVKMHQTPPVTCSGGTPAAIVDFFSHKSYS